jgi:hypothetical protein
VRWVERYILLLFFVIIINTVRREKVLRAEISLGLVKVRGQGQGETFGVGLQALGYRYWDMAMKGQVEGDGMTGDSLD